MSEDRRDLLEVLRYELNFLEQGGYGDSYSTPWGGASIFQDSLACPNHGDPLRAFPCTECILYPFVPPERRTEDVPCHHIPLNSAGATIHGKPFDEELVRDLQGWLRVTIAQLEAQRDQEGNSAAK